MKTISSITAALVLTAAIAVAGCAKNRGNAKGPSAKGSELEQKLAGVELSQPLTQTSQMSSCDEARAATRAESTVIQRAALAGDLWSDCQEIYACSPETADQIKKWFQSGASFQLGFTNLKTLNVAKLGDKVGGLYLSGTSKIFLDATLTGTKMACYMLLHELAHRFDPLAVSGEVSLRTEYYAYWHQTAYNDELMKLHEDLAVDLKASSSVGSGNQSDDVSSSSVVKSFHTRESLLKAVAAIYGFSVDPAIVKSYKKLPREPDIFPAPAASAPAPDSI